MEFSIVDKVDRTNEVEQLTEGEREDVFSRLVMGKDVTTKVATSRGEFIIKYPKQRDVITIGKLMAYHRNGLSAVAFDAFPDRVNMICSTLDVIVVSGPAWFEAARKANPNFSFQEVPDEEFNDELYQKASAFRTEMQKIIGKTSKPKAAPVPASENNKAAVGDGLFDGITEGMEEH